MLTLHRHQIRKSKPFETWRISDEIDKQYADIMLCAWVKPFSLMRVIGMCASSIGGVEELFCGEMFLVRRGPHIYLPQRKRRHLSAERLLRSV